MKIIAKISLFIPLIAVMIFFTVIIVRAFDTRGKPDLNIWHKVKLTNEFRAGDYAPGFTFGKYLQLEDKLFKELKVSICDRIETNEKNYFNRYNIKSPSSPEKFEQDYNRSYQLIPNEIRARILLIHGLTDSPYSMKALADFFYEQGFYVLSLRVPGHGTIPAELAGISWKDWTAAVKIAAIHASQTAGTDLPFYMGGFSNGGSLSLLYTLQSLQDHKLPRPDGLFLFSPAVGVSKFAALSDWMMAISFIPYFEKSKWLSIEPEYDPFKYTSFPLNASKQISNVCGQIQKSIARCNKNGLLSQMPPITTFQSVVDTTVVTSAITQKLYNKLTPSSHELVLFDVNRHSWLHNFFKSQHDRLLDQLTKTENLPYRLTVVTNKDADSIQVVARTREHKSRTFTEVDLDMAWPVHIYSLSHLAIPTPADDTLYGINPANDDSLHLGNIDLRGEKDTLLISAGNLMRLRSNPFFEFITNRIGTIVSDRDQQPEKACQITTKGYNLNAKD